MLGPLALILTLLSPATSPGRDSEEHGDAPTAIGLQPSPSPSPASQLDELISTNLTRSEARSKTTASPKDYQQQLNTARQLRRSQDTVSAAKMLVKLLNDELPPELQRSAIFELALVAQDAKQFSRAQQIFAQYIQLFPQDPTVPEVLLRQGLIFRQMGAHQLAITKFYAVMNTALGLKLDQFDYYRRLVLQAQTEIADSYYLQGKYAEASDFFRRILKQDTLELNRSQIQFKLVRCLSSLGKHPDVIALCEEFYVKYPAAGEVPELRFLCASSFKQLGRTAEALAQVLKLLESQQDSLQSNPENWIYWQQRAGNEIANQLYQEGDYLHALEVYTHLAGLNPAASWQAPVWYQMGLIYERLRQPQKAADRFTAIVARAKELKGPLGSPSLQTVLEMAQWRKEHLDWQNRAELAVQSLHLSHLPSASNQTTAVSTP